MKKKNTLTKRQVLARWKKLADDGASGAWTCEEDVSGLLEKFRPNGDGIEAIFEGIERGDEVCQRLREVYQATSRGEPGGLYFLPTPAKPVSREAVEKLLKQHFMKLRAVCQEMEATEGSAILAKMPKIQWVKQEPDSFAEGDENESYFVDVRIDYLDRLRGSQSQALLLDEALYMATTSPAVQDYVLWPLYRDQTKVYEPFRADFELWKRGVTWRWKNKSTIAVHIAPPPKPAKKPAKVAAKAKAGVPYPVAAALKRLQADSIKADIAEYSDDILGEINVKKIILGTLCSPVRMLGLLYGEAGVRRVLSGDPGGWAELQQGFRYLAWEYRIATACKQDQLERKLAKNPYVVFRVDEAESAATLLTAVSLRQDEFADFCGSRLMSNFTRGELLTKEIEWDGDPFAPFATLLYARWRGREEELRKTAVKGFFDALAKDRPEFRALIEDWDNDRKFTAAYHKLCDAFCEDAASPYGKMFFWAFPAELLAVARIRRALNMPDPLAQHPLGSSPLAQPPDSMPKAPADKLLQKAVSVCQKAYPKLPLAYSW